MRPVSKFWTSERRQRLFRELDRLTRLPLLLLSLIMVVILIAPLIVRVDSANDYILNTLSWLIYGVFLLDFAMKLLLVEDRWRFIRTHPLDVLIVLMPALGPLRALQGVRLLPALSAFRVLTFFLRAVQLLRALLLRRQMPLVLGFTAITVLVCAGLVTHFESGAGGPIEDYGDGLWWGVTTITTVGYGDSFPVTPEGRGIALFLMLVGITVFGVLTANLAAFFIEESSVEQREVEARLDQILARLTEIERRLDSLSNAEALSSARSEAAAIAEAASELASRRSS